MPLDGSLVEGVQAFRPFLPAKDFDLSLAFYKALGFEAHELGDNLVHLGLGRHAFLLQDYYVKDWAENTMIHVLVDDVAAWWRHIEALDLAARFGVKAPAPPREEPWGLTVAYVFDPCGLLWHFAGVTPPPAPP